MLTDRAPRKHWFLAAFEESAKNGLLRVPKDDQLKSAARRMEAALEAGARKTLQQTCAEFLNILAGFFEVDQLAIRILSARPVRTREGG